VFALGERVVVTTRAWQREREKLDKQDKEGKPATETETVLPGEAEAGVIWYERYVRLAASNTVCGSSVELTLPRAQILHYTTLKDVNIHQVQCLTLLAAFQASVNAVPMSWLLAGQALRVAQDLGLHVRTSLSRRSTNAADPMSSDLLPDSSSRSPRSSCALGVGGRSTASSGWSPSPSVDRSA
jgi:hypothetical protein